MKRSRSFLSSALLLLLALAPAFAEEGEKGRLPDGRAFRTDSQGNEIVDYIAELELTNDSLTRRVRGLETELEEVRAQLDKKGGAQSSALTERDLQTGAVTVTGGPESELARARAEVARIRELKNVEQQSARERIRSLEEALKQQGQGGAVSDSQREQTLQSLLREREIELNQVRAELADLQQNSGQTSVVALESKNQELIREVTSLRSELERKSSNDTEVSRLQAKVAALQEELSGKERLLKLAQNRPAVRDVERVTVASAPQNTEAALAPARTRAVDSLKGKLNTDLNNLKSAIADRDSLYQNYTKSGGKVSFTLAKPVSSRGIGVQEITGRLKAITSVNDLSALGRDIAEIRSKVEEDVRLIQRMNRVKSTS